MIDLQQKTVLVTRPKPQGEILAEKIRHAHGQPILFPTIEIKLPHDPNLLQQQIAELYHYDWLIFISQQAVYHSAALLHAAWPMLPKDLRVAAMGAGTANALQAENLPVTAFPTQWTSEGLLDLPIFQDVVGQHVALICGEGGRDLLEKTLRERGAEVDRFVAYQRTVPVYANINDYLDLFQQQKVDIIAITSKEGLLNLISLVGSVKEKLYSLPLVVVSERLVGVAEELHFKQVILAENASDQAVLIALEKGVNYGR